MVDIDVSREKAEINQKIDHAQHRIGDLESQLRTIDIELDSLFQDREQYILLSEISDRLDKLNKLGGTALFWGSWSWYERLTLTAEFKSKLTKRKGTSGCSQSS